MFKKGFTLFSIAVLIFGFIAPSYSLASEVIDDGRVDSDPGSIDWENDPEVVIVDPDKQTEEDKKMLEWADKLSVYFKEDANGNVEFTADKETLMELGISESDAELMSSVTSSDLAFSERDGDVQPQGFVGLHITIGPKVRNMTAVMAGAFAAAYVGWYVKKFAAMGAFGTAVAAAITAGVGIAVGTAVKKHYRYVKVGLYIPYVSLSYTVRLP